MKKKLACLLTALLVLSCATPVFAAPSAEASEDVAVVTEDGVELDVTVVEDEVVEEAEAEAEAVAEEAEAEATVVTVVDVNFEGEVPEGGLKVTIKVDGINAGDNVVLLHKLADGTWETITPDAVKDGEIVATFNSFSPVAVVVLEEVEADEEDEEADEETDEESDDEAEADKDETDADKDNAEDTAPKAGVPFVLPVAAVVCAAGAAICGRKVKFN